MPRVPTVDGQSVALNPLQTAPQRSSASPALLAGSAPQELSEAGRALADVGAKIQERTDVDLVMRAETELKNQYVGWEADAKQRKGQQAWGVAKDAAKWFDDNATKVGGDLTSDRQRFLFNQTVQKLRTQSLGTFSEFEADQRRVSLDQSAQASITGSINIAAANATQWQAPLYVATKDQPPGMVEKGNIDLAARPVVKNEDGSVSTVRSITVGIDGKEVVLPTVSPSGKMMTPDQAVEHYRKTGQHLGAFNDPKAADDYAEALHVQQERMYANGTANPIVTAKQDVIARSRVRAQINGWSPEMAAVAESDNLTNFHKQVIQSLVKDQPDQAQAYFQANKGEIAGSQQAEIGGFAQKATATHLGESTADATWQKFGPKGDRDPVQLDVLEGEIRKQLGDKDEARKAAIAAVRERASAFKDSRKERDDQTEASVNTAILNGAGVSQIQRMPEFLMLDGEKQRKIVDFVESRGLRREQQSAARESRAASAESRAQSQLARQGMGAYLAYSNPDTLAGMSESQVLNLLPSLGNELTSHLMTQKRALANPGKLAEARMDAEDFAHIGRQMQLPMDERATPEQKELVGELKYRVEQRIAAVQQANGKPMARNEKMDLMRNEMARTVTVGGWFSNSEVPVIALTPKQVQDVVIPQQDRRALAEAMSTMYQRTGAKQYEPTDGNLRRFYLLRKSPSADMILPKK